MYKNIFIRKKKATTTNKAKYLERERTIQIIMMMIIQVDDNYDNK